MEKKVTLKLLSIISIPLGAILSGFGIWCIISASGFRESHELNRSNMMIWITAVTEIVQNAGSAFMEQFFMCIGVICFWCGIELLICSLFGIVTSKNASRKTYRRFLWLCRIMCIPVLIMTVIGVARSIPNGENAFIWSFSLYATGAMLLCLPQMSFIKTVIPELEKMNEL